MTDKISQHMQHALDAIRDGGNTAEPVGGGWWKGADGKRLQYDAPAGFHTRLDVQRTTIYALARRGLLQRMHKRREGWRDTYIAMALTT